jgi:hypothetical protein
MMKTYNILLSFFLILISGMGFSQSVPSYVPTNGLVGWWGFNGNAQDGSGNGNHLVNNSCTFTLNRHGQINSAIDLVGPNKWLGGSVIQTTVQPVLPNLSTSMSMWCKVVNISFGEIYHQGTGSSGFGLYLQGGSTLLGTKLFVLDNGVNGNVTNIQNGGYDLGLGQWKHIVLSKVGNQVDLYFNGLFHSNGFLSLNALNSGWLNFGVPDIGEGNVDVHLDDIGIWNRALTQQEITNLYNSQFPIQTSLCLPTITTSSPSSVGVDTVVIGGDISNDGGSSIVLRGVCYSTSPNPNMGNQRTEDGSGTGSFNTVLRGLTSSTTYYARSYAKNSNGVVVYGNEVSFTTGLGIGSFHSGGIVFFLDSTGEHGLVCATSDQGSFPWGCYGTNIGTSTSIGTGQINTNLILSQCSNRPIAASVCDDLILNGYSDWYLPSKDELDILYTNLRNHPVAGFGNSGWYWSSSQLYSLAAWFLFLDLGIMYGSGGKFNPGTVRAIRSF